jgi:hypothetical protein
LILENYCTVKTGFLFIFLSFLKEKTQEEKNSNLWRQITVPNNLQQDSEGKRTFCKLDVSDVLKQDVLKPEVLWVYQSPKELCRLYAEVVHSQRFDSVNLVKKFTVHVPIRKKEKRNLILSRMVF